MSTPSHVGQRPTGLTEGRIVHYVMADGTHRAALVVRVWSLNNGCANLQVFADGGNDEQFMGGAKYNYVTNMPSILWRTSVVYDNLERRPYTWHYPEHVE